MDFHLAQLNIARMRAESIDDPLMIDFVRQLALINTLADSWPGFVWRLQSDSGNATDIRAFEDPRLIINLTVWENIEALFEYTYGSGHVEVFRRRADWFEKLPTPALVMWWIPAGHVPTLAEAREKLDHLTAHGPTPDAFTFKQHFTVEEMLQTKKQKH